jgi:hypothetical protein
VSASGVPGAGRVSARTIQIGLGVMWLLDGLLQLQPRMFGPDFADQVILPAAQGQPGLVSSVITHMAHLIALQPALTNTVFAGIQILIGVGLLIRETVRPALALSFAWALGVWALGEGFGMLFTGMASPLTGAPGGALLYAAVGLLVWPRPGRMAASRGVAGPAAAEGPLGVGGGRAVWAIVWGSMGILWLLPANRADGSVSGAISGAVTGEPSWLAHVQLSVAHAFANGGGWVAVVGAALSFVIGLGPLFSRHTTVFLVAGAALALDYWMFGEALGQPFSGIATDPNTGPLLVLLALTLYPNRAPERGGAGLDATTARSRTATIALWSSRETRPESSRQNGSQLVADEPSQSSTWRRVVGPWGCQAEGSAPSWRSSAASEMFAVSGSWVRPHRMAVGSRPKRVAALRPNSPAFTSAVNAG